MTLLVLNNNGEWDLLDGNCKMKGLTFERLITRYVKFISDFGYEYFVTMRVSIHDARVD